jgi:hypothetical protein
MNTTNNLERRIRNLIAAPVAALALAIGGCSSVAWAEDVNSDAIIRKADDIALLGRYTLALQECQKGIDAVRRDPDQINDALPRLKAAYARLLAEGVSTGTFFDVNTGAKTADGAMSAYVAATQCKEKNFDFDCREIVLGDLYSAYALIEQSSNRWDVAYMLFKYAQFRGADLGQKGKDHIADCEKHLLAQYGPQWQQKCPITQVVNHLESARAAAGHNDTNTVIRSCDNVLAALGGVSTFPGREVRFDAAMRSIMANILRNDLEKARQLADNYGRERPGNDISIKIRTTNAQAAKYVKDGLAAEKENPGAALTAYLSAARFVPNGTVEQRMALVALRDGKMQDARNYAVMALTKNPFLTTSFLIYAQSYKPGASPDEKKTSEKQAADDNAQNKQYNSYLEMFTRLCPWHPKAPEIRELIEKNNNDLNKWLNK